jgi:hypothetical protein
MVSPRNPEVSPFSDAAHPPTPRASRRHAKRRRQRRDQQLVAAVAVVAALLAGATASAPTGFAVADAAWCAALAAGSTWAGSRSRRWAWLWSAGVVAAGGVGSWWSVVGVAALVVALSGAFTKTRSRPLGAVVGALVATMALHLPSQAFHGFPSLVAAAALVPLFLSAYERSSRQVTGRINRGLLVAGLVVVAACAAFGLSASLARSSLNQAVAQSRVGLDQVRAGHQSDAGAELAGAADNFDHAAHLLDAFWTWPARLVPVVAQQRDALARASSAGSQIARSGSVAASVAPYQQLKASDGRVDLPTIRRMTQPVADTAAALTRAQHTLRSVRNGWLIAPVASPLADFSRQVDGALPQAQLASSALIAAPGLLGAGQDRTYLILFTNPAESRFLGGFAGSFGILTAHDGKVSFTVGDRIAALFPGPAAAKLAVTGETSYLARYGRYDPAHNLQNLTVAPDFPTDATVTRSLFKQYYGTSLDGILVVDPYALAALLQLTGPVQVDGLAQPLTAQNAAQYLVYQQYVTYGNAKDDRKDILAAAGRSTFKALTSRDLPGPADVGAALGPVVAQGRLLFYPFTSSALPLFRRIGTLGTFRPAAGSDYLSVRSANANANKIDSLLTRAIDYQAAYDPSTGRVEATATITLHNGSPPGGLPEYLIGNLKDPSNGGKVPVGTNTMYLSYYSPLTLSSSTLDGQPIGVEYQMEAGAKVYSSDISLAPGQTSVFVLHLSGSVPAGSTYHLQVLSQPLVNPDALSVHVRSSSPSWHVASSQGLSAEQGGTVAAITAPLVHDERLSVTFAR